MCLLSQFFTSKLQYLFTKISDNSLLYLTILYITLQTYTDIYRNCQSEVIRFYKENNLFSVLEPTLHQPFLTNKKESFKNSGVVEDEIFDNHSCISTALKSFIEIEGLQIQISSKKILTTVSKISSLQKIPVFKISFRDLEIYHKHRLIIKRISRLNDNSFMTKSFRGMPWYTSQN